MKMNFRNKTIIITGGEGGLGKSITKDFLKMGGTVFVTTTKKQLLKKNNKRKKYMYLDFNNKVSVRKFLEDLKKIKKIDVLINNAGVSKISAINEVDEKFLEEIYKINLKGPILLTKEISPEFRLIVACISCSFPYLARPAF